jgi:hypothetical protein
VFVVRRTTGLLRTAAVYNRPAHQVPPPSARHETPLVQPVLTGRLLA